LELDEEDYVRGNHNGPVSKATKKVLVSPKMMCRCRTNIKIGNENW